MTDHSMVERVAHAIFPELWDSDADYASSYPLGWKQVEKGRVEALTRAHAAIEAMREPTDVMVNEALEQCDKNGYAVSRGMVDKRDVWTAYVAMIDAALAGSAGE